MDPSTAGTASTAPILDAARLEDRTKRLERWAMKARTVLSQATAPTPKAFVNLLRTTATTRWNVEQQVFVPAKTSSGAVPRAGCARFR